MHYTHEEEDALRAEIDAAKATMSSAEAPSKTAGPVGSLAVTNCSEAPRAGSDYEARLAEWKARMGFREPHDVEDEQDQDQALMAGDRKLPGEDYCVHCGEGPTPISALVLITRRMDPYIQDEPDPDEDEELTEPSHRVRACPTCYKLEYETEDEAPEPPNAKAQPDAQNL